MPSPRIGKGIRYDLLLTPQFYTLQKKTLPIKFAYQARRLAPSVFSGLLEEEKAYRYFVYPEGETWVFIAYDPEEITAFLHGKGIASEHIDKLYFAEQFASQLDAPLPIDEDRMLGRLEGTAVLGPASLFETENTTRIDALQAPQKGVHLGSVERGALFTQKQSMILSLLLALLATAWIVQGIRYDKRLSPIEEKIERIYAKEPSLRSRYTRESIYEKYKGLDKQQRAARAWLSTLSKKLFDGVLLESVDFREHEATVLFGCKDANVLRRFKNAVSTIDNVRVTVMAGNRIEIKGRF